MLMLAMASVVLLQRSSTRSMTLSLSHSHCDIHTRSLFVSSSSSPPSRSLELTEQGLNADDATDDQRYEAMLLLAAWGWSLGRDRADQTYRGG